VANTKVGVPSGAQGKNPFRIIHVVISGICHNPKIKAFYNRLISSGKKHKVAITACMRKLMIILNTMIKMIPAGMNQAVKK